MNSHFARFAILGLSAMLGVSCGAGTASLSPTAPSSTASGRTGAVIAGQVNSAAAPVSTRGVTDLPGTVETRAGTAASVSVKVVGTNISTTTNGQGQFTLTGVPPGDVRLEFTGPGGSATITISGVGATDEIQISITLNGGNARVDSEQRRKRDRDDDDEDDDDRDRESRNGTRVELKGLVSGLTGTCPALTFTVQGATVKTTSSTEFEEIRCADLANGASVEVKGTRQTDGSVTAMEVERSGGSGSGSTKVELKGLVSGVTGTCPALTFTVQNTTVKTSSMTEFEDVRCADVRNGVTVEVEGTRQTDGSIAATSVERD